MVDISKCKNCGDPLFGKRLYDDRLEAYFCDKQCLTEQIEWDFDSFLDWYCRLNISEEDGLN